MTPAVTTAALLADLRALWSRERALIVALGAPFLFLPVFALKLLTPPLPAPPAQRPEAALLGWTNAFLDWSRANGGWYVLADAVVVLGIAALTILLLDPERPTVGEALTRAMRRWPRYVIASMLAALPIGVGFVLLYLPGLYLQARLIAITPALAGERVSAAGALGRSWRITAGAQGALFGAAVLLFLAQWIALIPLAPLDAWLRAPTHLNPVVLALVDAGFAAVTALYRVGLVLLGIVAYRRLAS